MNTATDPKDPIKPMTVRIPESIKLRIKAVAEAYNRAHPGSSATVQSISASILAGHFTLIEKEIELRIREP